jgi:hypothetical protein
MQSTRPRAPLTGSEEPLACYSQMNGTDLNGDGTGDLYGACFDIGVPVCKVSGVRDWPRRTHHNARGGQSPATNPALLATG